METPGHVAGDKSHTQDTCCAILYQYHAVDLILFVIDYTIYID